MENFNKSVYKDAYEHADKVLELIHPILRQALMEAYSKGFRECYKIYNQNG